MKRRNIPERIKRHLRFRKKVFGTKQKPRLSVFRSYRNIFVQFIDDTTHSTLLTASTLDKDFKEKSKIGGNVKAAGLLGEIVAKRAKENKIEKIIFDRGGYLYHGRIKALAEALRKGGLIF